jgi:hypothetical protein
VYVFYNGPAETSERRKRLFNPFSGKWEVKGLRRFLKLFNCLFMETHIKMLESFVKKNTKIAMPYPRLRTVFCTFLLLHTVYRKRHMDAYSCTYACTFLFLCTGFHFPRLHSKFCRSCPLRAKRSASLVCVMRIVCRHCKILLHSY